MQASSEVCGCNAKMHANGAPGMWIQYKNAYGSLGMRISYTNVYKGLPRYADTTQKYIQMAPQGCGYHTNMIEKDIRLFTPAGTRRSKILKISYLFMCGRKVKGNVSIFAKCIHVAPEVYEYQKNNHTTASPGMRIQRKNVYEWLPK